MNVRNENKYIPDYYTLICEFVKEYIQLKLRKINTLVNISSLKILLINFN